jgi:hypothetical protein
MLQHVHVALCAIDVHRKSIHVMSGPCGQSELFNETSALVVLFKQDTYLFFVGMTT